MTEQFTPIAVFAYNRPDHLLRTLATLLACDGFDERHVTIFIDGPRDSKDTRAVSDVRSVAMKMMGPNADIRLAGTNNGLSQSITKGVTELVNKYGRVIVVEDDLELAPGFLRYMNAALDKYEGNQNIYQVSGHMFDVPEFASRSQSILLPLTTTWGWATWSRAWKKYDSEAAGWQRLRADRALRKRFDLDGAYPFSGLMERQARGLSDSWGIRWYWSVFKAGGLVVFPPQTLVRNRGQDGSGTHGGGLVADFSGKDGALPASVPQLSNAFGVDRIDLADYSRAIWRQNGGWLGWAITQLRRILER